MIAKISLDPTKFKVINSIITVLLFAQAFCRVTLAWNDNESKPLLVTWLLYTLVLGTINLMGEFRKPENIIVWFPLILTRCGRGAIFIFLSMMMFANEPVSAVLGVIVLIGAVFNIVVGWNDPAVVITQDKSVTKLPMPQAETEMPQLQ